LLIAIYIILNNFFKDFFISHIEKYIYEKFLKVFNSPSLKLNQNIFYNYIEYSNNSCNAEKEADKKKKKTLYKSCI